MDFNFDAHLELQNERALIRPLTEEHLPYLLPVAIKDKNLLQYSPTAIYTGDLLEKYIATAIADRKNGIRYAFAIWDKQKEKYAGSTSYASISNKDKRLEIGYTWIGKEFQGSGLNARVKSLLLHYAFTQLKFERVEFKTDERNITSRKAIEKLGAIYEGTLRSHMLMPDGYRRNSVYYSILRTEWETQNI